MKRRQMIMDWEYLRPSLLRLGAVALGGAAIAAGIWHLTETGRLALFRTGQRLDSVRLEYELTTQIRATMEEFQAEFQGLQTRGILGEESRLAWIELVETIAGELSLPGVSISLQPQQPYQNLNLPPIRAPVKITVMNLDLRLFHEGDLLLLLETLKKRTPGIFWVRACDLRRKEIFRTVAQLRREGLIDARCELLWLTLPAANDHGGGTDEQNDSADLHRTAAGAGPCGA